jgi:hypothetical protein
MQISDHYFFFLRGFPEELWATLPADLLQGSERFQGEHLLGASLGSCSSVIAAHGLVNAHSELGGPPCIRLS